MTELEHEIEQDRRQTVNLGPKQQECVDFLSRLFDINCVIAAMLEARKVKP